MNEFETKEEAQHHARQLAALWVGTVWTHRKGGRYQICSVAVDEATLEIAIVYFSLARDSWWTRSLRAWLEPVEGRPRFWREGEDEAKEAAGLVPPEAE